MVTKALDKVTGVDENLLQKIDQLKLSKRLCQWKATVMDIAPRICSERAKLAMESWKESEDDDLEIRRAKLMGKILGGITIAIHDGQLIVGGPTKYLIGGTPHIDYCGDYMPGLREKGKEVAVGTPVVKGTLPEQERQILRECSDFFKGKTAGDHMKKTFDAIGDNWYDDWIEAGGEASKETGGFWVFGAMGHKVLDKGLRGIIKEAESNIGQFIDDRETDFEKLHFWKAAIISCEVAISFARRYAECARHMASTESDARRKAELEEIADVCMWVPENAPRTFHEAVQSITFIHLVSALEKPIVPFTIGRMDQYLWPYFEADIKEGRLELEKAADLIGGFLAYVSSLVRVQDISYTEYVHSSLLVSNLTLGGVTRNGDDANNELTYLILHVAGLLSVPEPHISYRWHPDTPRWALLKAIETNVQMKGGNPVFMSDVHVIDYWVKRGVSLEEARDCLYHGCGYPLPPSKIFGQRTGHPNMALILDLTLRNGKAWKTGTLVGLETGDPRNFKTFEELKSAFLKQYEFILQRLLWLLGSMTWTEGPQYVRVPFMSSLLPGCVEIGKDGMFGGSEGFNVCMSDRAIVDAADSLMAIKKMVFDDQKLTMDEFLNVLESNFEGARGQEVQQMCLAAPKFGNDIDEVDQLTGELGAFSAAIADADRPENSPPATIFRDGLAWHYFGGKSVGAMPNGRNAGEPLNDGSISPMRGQDKLGPTAVFNSAIKAGWKESAMSLLNQKISGSFMKSPDSREKLAMLTETFLANGGQNIQYNLVNADELREAQLHPEQYKDLMVRVAGFSAYFVTLNQAVQNDIISRSEQSI